MVAMFFDKSKWLEGTFLQIYLKISQTLSGEKIFKVSTLTIYGKTARPLAAMIILLINMA